MSNQQLIPLSVPNIAGNEWKYVKDCLDTGWISSVGAYVPSLSKWWPSLPALNMEWQQ